MPALIQNTASEFTQLLMRSVDGDSDAFDRLFPIVYNELRVVAHNRLRRERPGHTLNTTALVHEAYLKLVGLDAIQYKGRSHFFAVAAQAMRNVLVSYALRRKAERRGGGKAKVPLDDAVLMTDRQVDVILDLNEALKRLETLSKRQFQVVDCRFFGGMSVEEVAAALEISEATVKRDWRVARAWLNRELGRDAFA